MHMVAKRGRPQSDETKKLRREQERVETERKRTENMLDNLPSHIKKLPICQLTQGLANSLEIQSKELLNDYSHRPFTPPNLIFALNDEVVSPENIKKYRGYLNAPKKGAEAKRDKGWDKVKEMCGRENNKILIDRISPSDLNINEVAQWIFDEWPTRGIAGEKRKSVRQINRDIKRYLQQ
jgi:hypothetical protein